MTHRSMVRRRRAPTIGLVLAGGALLAGLLGPAAALAVVSAGPDVISIDEDTAATGNVLANDTGDGSLTVLAFTPLGAKYGSLTIAANGDFTYTPAANWHGFTTTSYRVGDGIGSALSYVSITVAAVNDPPVAAPQSVSTDEDGAVEITLVGTDPDDDALTYAIGTGPEHGTLTGSGANRTYTPDPEFAGSDAFTFTVSDGTVETAAATVTITVAAVPDDPIALPKDAATDEDTPVQVTEATLLAGATDADGDALTVSAVGGEVGGTAALAAGIATFTPTANLCGNDAAGFDYTVSDGTGGTDTARVTIDITCVEDLPVASSQDVNVAYRTATDVTLVASDGDGDDLGWTIVTDPAHGSLAGTAPELVYTPDGAYVGTDSFTFTVSDGDDVSNLATVSITVAPDTTPPVVAVPTVKFGTGRVNESAPLKVTWSAGDAGTGVKTYTVEAKVGSGAWTQIYSGTGTSATKLYPFGQNLYWRVKAEDNAGNVSDWTTSAKRKLAAYQGGSPVAYSGTWRSIASSSSSGSGYKYTTTLGKRVYLSFTGMGVLYVAPKTSTAGYVKVSTGGVTTRVNLRASSSSPGVIVRSKMWSTVGSHSIKVVNNSSGRRANFDVFVVLK